MSAGNGSPTPLSETHCRGARPDTKLRFRLAAAILFLLLSPLALASVGGTAAVSQHSGEPVEAARRAFVSFDFVGARDQFADVLAHDPNDPEAAYGHARALSTLNQFEEAVGAYERALELNANNPRLHEGLLYTLVWGGKLRGRRDWLDRALEAGGDTLRRFPNSVRSYDLVQDAASELNQGGLWLRILESLEPTIGTSPVYQVHAFAARLASARAQGDQEAIEAIEAALRARLEVAAETEAKEQGDDSDPNAARRYLLAKGHQLLDDSDQERAWIARLDETAQGRRMGARLTHFDRFYRPFLAARDEPVDERMRILEKWQERFHPQWEIDFTSFRVPRQFEFDLLRSQAQEQMHENGSVNPALLDQLVEIGRELVRMETWFGAATYSQVSLTLLEFDGRQEIALELADEAIEGLESGRAGLIYPGNLGSDFDRDRTTSLASFHRIRGLALAALGDDLAAEAALRSAIELEPRSDRLASLGEFLVEQERQEEAYPLLVRALAYNQDDERIADKAEVTRALALVAAERSGRTADALESDLEAARGESIAEARNRILADRLDRPAPDFELVDLDGRTWRLSELAGKVVALNFWATWCGPCRTEMPHYQQLVRDYAEEPGVVFLAITTDNDQGVTRGFLEEHEYVFTVLLDEGTSTDFQVTGVPSSYLIDSAGRIQYAMHGFTNPERYAREMRWRIEALLHH